MTDLPSRGPFVRHAARLARAACCIALCCVLPTATGVMAARYRPPSVIAVPYGLTRVPLTRDGVPALLVRARRDNFNAHGFDVLSIYALTKGHSGKRPPLLLVSVWDKDKERLAVTAGGGADCLLHGFRLLGGPGRDLELVLAQRDFGRSYTDAGEVTFTRYVLRHNTGEIGRPDYYFQSDLTFKAKRKYCDVDEAFSRELGLRAQ